MYLSFVCVFTCCGCICLLSVCLRVMYVSVFCLCVLHVVYVSVFCLCVYVLCVFYMHAASCKGGFHCYENCMWHMFPESMLDVSHLLLGVYSVCVCVCVCVYVCVCVRVCVYAIMFICVYMHVYV